MSKAISSGRLSASVSRDMRGAPRISDPDLADREWAENTRARVDYVGKRRPRQAAPPAVPPDAGEVAADDRVPSADPAAPAAAPAVSPELAAYYRERLARESAAARREAIQVELAEIVLAERRSAMIPVAVARRDVMDRYARLKTRLLAVSSRLAQQLPHLAAELVPLLDEAIRDALEELAGDVG